MPNPSIERIFPESQKTDLILNVITHQNMNRILFTVLIILAAMLVAGCTVNSADDRVRSMFGIPENQPLTENLLAESIAKIFPLGTAEPRLAEIAKGVGVGKDKRSSYGLIKERNLAIIRVELDPSTLGLVKSEWIISLQLDSSQMLQSIGAQRYLTGL